MLILCLFPPTFIVLSIRVYSLQRKIVREQKPGATSDAALAPNSGSTTKDEKDSDAQPNHGGESNVAASEEGTEVLNNGEPLLAGDSKKLSTTHSHEGGNDDADDADEKPKHEHQVSTDHDDTRRTSISKES